MTPGPNRMCTPRARASCPRATPNLTYRYRCGFSVVVLRFFAPIFGYSCPCMIWRNMHKLTRHMPVGRAHVCPILPPLTPYLNSLARIRAWPQTRPGLSATIVVQYFQRIFRPQLYRTAVNYLSAQLKRGFNPASLKGGLLRERGNRTPFAKQKPIFPKKRPV